MTNRTYTPPTPDRSHPAFQYAYCRTPLYCAVDDSWIDITGCDNEYLMQDGELSAPECVPTGSTHGRDTRGYSNRFLDFVTREPVNQEETVVADEIISEILNNS